MRAVILLVMLPAAVLGQKKPDPPIQTTVCDVLKSPELFSGKIITLRGEVQIGFESFSLSTSGCVEKKTDSELWLEYGRGPRRQPTIWCCGDMVPRDRLALVQDSEFRKFHRHLTVAKDPHRVTATLTGRFDSREPQEGSFGCGFGHLGSYCSRLVIQRVSNVAALPAVGPGKTR